jgi:hypothetical protein
MDPAKLFSIANMLALAGWLLLTLLPRWRYTNLIVVSGIIPLLLSVLYLTLIIVYFGDAEGSFGSLEGVMQLFQNRYAVLTGWVHYLAFDLFVGSWELRNSEKHNIPLYLVIPCLFLTFMFGPVGLLMYFIVRGIKTKKFLHENF